MPGNPEMYSSEVIQERRIIKKLAEGESTKTAKAIEDFFLEGEGRRIKLSEVKETLAIIERLKSTLELLEKQLDKEQKAGKADPSTQLALERTRGDISSLERKLPDDFAPEWVLKERKNAKHLEDLEAGLGKRKAQAQA